MGQATPERRNLGGNGNGIRGERLQDTEKNGPKY